MINETEVILEFVRMISIVKPDYLILENVTGLMGKVNTI